MEDFFTHLGERFVDDLAQRFDVRLIIAGMLFVFTLGALKYLKSEKLQIWIFSTGATIAVSFIYIAESLPSRILQALSALFFVGANVIGFISPAWKKRRSNKGKRAKGVTKLRRP